MEHMEVILYSVSIMYLCFLHNCAVLDQMKLVRMEQSIFFEEFKKADQWKKFCKYALIVSTLASVQEQINERSFVIIYTLKYFG